jgi:hypothetical protein
LGLASERLRYRTWWSAITAAAISTTTMTSGKSGYSDNFGIFSKLERLLCKEVTQ